MTMFELTTLFEALVAVVLVLALGPLFDRATAPRRQPVADDDDDDWERW
jgi:hypothetical protein